MQVFSFILKTAMHREILTGEEMSKMVTREIYHFSRSIKTVS